MFPDLLAAPPFADPTGIVQVPRTHAQTVVNAAGEPYRILLSWPAGEPPAGGWPVLYLLGGDSFLYATEFLRYRAGGGTVDSLRPGIVVSIAYPGETRRAYDYTPFLPPAAPAGSAGGADALRAFLLDTIRPAVEAALPVDRGRQTLAGHSLGGLFVLHTLFARPDAFQQWLASSPSVWWQDAQLLEAARRFVMATSAAGVHGKLWLSAAEYEQAPSAREAAASTPEELAKIVKVRGGRRMVDDNRALAELLRGHPGLHVTWRDYPGETHRTVVPLALAWSLTEAFAP